ncbi:MAG TPA: hypothetical protein VIM63_10240, partial [Rhodoferax sp.]
MSSGQGYLKSEVEVSSGIPGFQSQTNSSAHPVCDADSFHSGSVAADAVGLFTSRWTGKHCFG